MTNDHFDEDGLIALFVMIDPETALSMRDLLCDASHAGDFATYRSRQAARMAFALSTLADRSTSPQPKDAFPDAYPQFCAEMYSRLLPMIPDMAGDTESFRDLWSGEEAVLDDSERALDAGEITLEEDVEADLVVVRIPTTRQERPAHRFTQDRMVLCHPMTIHNRSHCNRVATVCSQGLRFGYRYESWVQMVNDPPPPRVDLSPLATQLTELETGGAAWVFDGVEQLTPALHIKSDTESTVDPERFLSMLSAARKTGAPAWDPYD